MKYQLEFIHQEGNTSTKVQLSFWIHKRLAGYHRILRRKRGKCEFLGRRKAKIGFRNAKTELPEIRLPTSEILLLVSKLSSLASKL